MNPPLLTGRKQEILVKLAEGKSYDQIAQELGLSTSTVRTHLHQLYAQLDVPDRAHAVILAWRKGWVKGPDAGETMTEADLEVVVHALAFYRAYLTQKGGSEAVVVARQCQARRLGEQFAGRLRNLRQQREEAQDVRVADGAV